MVKRVLVAVVVSSLSGCGLFGDIGDPVFPADTAPADAESETGGDAPEDGSSELDTGDTAPEDDADSTTLDGSPAVDSGADVDADADSTSVDSGDAYADSAVSDSGGEAAADTAMDTAACVEGVVSCSGANLEKCVGGKKTLVETCATPELCAASGSGPCKAPSCSVAEKRCTGKNLETCNVGRTAFELSATCDLTCSAAECLTLKHIEGGQDHACALMSNGTVRCWGRGSLLGIGTSDAKLTPTEVPGLKNVVQLAAGLDHACARLSDGKVKCWGNNTFYQIGDGSPSVGARLYPTEAFTVVDAVEVGAGAALTCVRLVDGTVSCWGQQTTKTSPGPESTLHASAKAIGITQVTQIAVGAYHACGLKKDGTVYCWWGANSRGELGDGTTEPTMTVTKASISGVKQIVAGESFTCALMSADNTVRCWGGLFDAPKGYGSTPVTVVGLSGVASLSAKGYTVCATLIAGDRKCWGPNFFGEVGDGTKVERLVPTNPTALASVLTGRTISHGAYQTFVFASTAAYAVGLNEHGQLGNGIKGGEYYLAPEKVLW